MLRKTTVIIILLLTGCASASSQRAWDDAEMKTRLSCAVPVIGCLPNLFFSAGGLINKAVSNSKEKEAEEDKQQGLENGSIPAEEAVSAVYAEGDPASGAILTDAITDKAGDAGPRQH